MYVWLKKKEKNDVMNFRPPTFDSHNISAYLLRDLLGWRFHLTKYFQGVYKKRWTSFLRSFLKSECHLDSLACKQNCIFYFSVEPSRINAREFTRNNKTLFLYIYLLSFYLLHSQLLSQYSLCNTYKLIWIWKKLPLWYTRTEMQNADIRFKIALPYLIIA